MDNVLASKCTFKKILYLPRIFFCLNITEKVAAIKNKMSSTLTSLHFKHCEAQIVTQSHAFTL